MLPQLSPTDRTPSPPIKKLSTGKLSDSSYPQASVDSVDNICKWLILLEFSGHLQTAYKIHLIQCPLC